MKKFFSILLSSAFLFTLAICLTGCKGRVTERQLKNMVEKALEEKYSEEFECSAILNQNPNGSYNCVCYPVSNEKLKFEARIYTDGRFGGDYYPKSIASAELSEAFDNALGNSIGKHLTYAYTAGGPDDDETAQRIASREFSLEFFLKRYQDCYNMEGSKYSIYYTVCVDTSDLVGSFDDEWEAISKALNEVHELGLKYGSDFTFWIDLYFTPPEIYKKCENYLSHNAQLRSGFEANIVGFPQEYNRLIEFAVVYSKNRFSPTKEEYVELRKEID